MLALYVFEFRSRPMWMAALGLALVMGLASIWMLIAGGPLPWFWRAAWFVGTLWGVVPFLTQLLRNVREAERRDRPGDILESALDDTAMWIRNRQQYSRLPFGEYELAATSGKYRFVRLRTGKVAIALPAELFPATEPSPNFKTRS